MRITICAVGRVRKGPEADLLERYLSRFDAASRSLGLRLSGVCEIDVKPATPVREAEALLRHAPAEARRVALDERGDQMSSPAFADQIAAWRDDGVRDTVFLLGGAQGLCHDLVASADARVSFGKMVWPHVLARVMLAEQLYRAATILAGTPYHKT